MSYQFPPDSQLLLRLPDVAPWQGLKAVGSSYLRVRHRSQGLVCDSPKNRFDLVSDLADVLRKPISSHDFRTESRSVLMSPVPKGRQTYRSVPQ